MCKSIHSKACSSMEDLTQQLGDESQLGFLLLHFCEYIIGDADLRPHFEHLTMDQMSTVLSSLIKTALESNLVDDKARNVAVMKNYTLFELGITARRFKKLSAHFESALRYCWIEEAMIQEFSKKFGKLESIFQDEGAVLRKSAKAHRALVSKFATALPPTVGPA